MHVFTPGNPRAFAHTYTTRFPARAHRNPPQYIHSIPPVVDDHSFGVESIPYVLSPPVPTPDGTRFQRKMDSSRPVDQMHLICAVSQPRRNVQGSGGTSCRGKSLSAECLFSRTFLECLRSRRLVCFAPPDSEAKPRGIPSHPYSLRSITSSYFVFITCSRHLISAFLFSA